MAGVDFERARAVLDVLERFHVEIAIAVGRHCDPERRPAPLQAAEGPTPRRPVGEIAFAGQFRP